MVQNRAVDEAVFNVTEAIRNAADAAIPRTSNSPRKLCKPWWNASCQQAKKEQRRAWGIFRRYPTTDNLIAFKRAKALAGRIRRQCQRESWIQYVSSITSSTTSQQLWRKVKAANGLYREFNIPILETSTALFSSPLDVANLIGKTFASVSSSDSYSPAFQATKNRLERTPINFRCRQPLPYNCDFDMFELKRALSSAHNTSPGPDGISPSGGSPPLVSKAVQGSAGSVKSIKKLPSGDLLIETATQAQSINLLQCTNLSNIPITATPHKTLNSSKGVIYCPDLIPLPDSEIEEELASQGVEAVKRITSIKDGKTITSPLFILTFSKHTLPENILIGYLNIKIRPYIPNPLRCFRCQSYGHGTASCRGVATCNKCSSTEHASEACTTERRKCANCKGEHAAYSKICPKWQQEKEIQRIKVLENISYSEAKKRVVNILPPRASTSYANAPITNNLIDQETILSPPETSSTDLESLNQTKHLLTPDTSHLSVPSDAEALMEIDKSSIKRPATDIVQEAAKILKPSIRIESGGIQATKEVDVKLLSKKGKIETKLFANKIRLRKSLKALLSRSINKIIQWNCRGLWKT
ncbi:putative RNA-directed DNA polymerase from transposon X-element [Trichonephila clavipes]|nr:putative RNA-directed DNA polymerase from transposon X-element [Trichonephila clavipes]